MTVERSRRPLPGPTRGRCHVAVAAGLALTWHAAHTAVCAAQSPPTASGAPAAPTAPAQDTAGAAEGRKSAVTATLLSAVVPGTGHLYAANGRTGAVLLALFAGGIAVGAAGENATSSIPAALLTAGPWWYGVLDARRAVRRYNRGIRRGGARTPAEAPGAAPPDARYLVRIAPTLAGGGRASGLGVRIGVRVTP